MKTIIQILRAIVDNRLVAGAVGPNQNGLAGRTVPIGIQRARPLAAALEEQRIARLQRSLICFFERTPRCTRRATVMSVIPALAIHVIDCGGIGRCVGSGHGVDQTARRSNCVIGGEQHGQQAHGEQGKQAASQPALEKCIVLGKRFGKHW